MDLSDLDSLGARDKQFLKNLADQTWRLNNLYTIVNKQGKVVRFKPNWAQQRILGELTPRHLIPKGRQFGISTLIGILQLDCCLFQDNFSALTICHNLEDAEKLFWRNIKGVYDRLPEWLQEMVGATRDRARDIRFSNGSVVSVATSGRSGAYNLIHVCLAGDTGIYTKDAKIKRIDEIKTGDKVLTGKGSYREVQGVAKNRLSDVGQKLLKVNVFGYYEPLKITDQHEVLTRKNLPGHARKNVAEWKPAGELKVGDYIAMPRREVSNKFRDGKVAFGDARIPPDFDLGWVCGFYLAEGTTRERRGNPPCEAQFSIHRNETEVLMERLRPILEQCSQVHCDAPLVRMYDPEGTKTRCVHVNSKQLAGFLHKHFGCGDNKTIPDKVWNWGSQFVRGLMKGYIDGDGSYRDPNIVSVTSTRRQLLDQMRLLFISMSYGVPTLYFEPAHEKHGRNNRDSWTLKLGGAGNWKFREEYGLELPEVNTARGKWRLEHGRRPGGRKFWRRGSDYYWQQVRSISDADPEEYVYDIILDEDPHNYVTVNGVVHNSEFGKICAKYPDKAREIVTGTFEAAGKDQIVAVESTAEGGAYGYFYDYCMDAKRAQDEQRKLTEMDWRMSFLEWYKHPEYVANPMHVTLPQELVEYFEKLEYEKEIKLSPARKAWYYGKWKTLGEDIKQEYPCIAGDVPILLPSGIVPMDQAQPDNGRVQGFTASGEKECVEIVTTLGYRLKCTLDHRILTPEGFVEAGGLGEGGEVRIGRWCSPEGVGQTVTYSELPFVESSIEVTEEFAEFIGIFVGDGSYSGKTLSVVCDAHDDDAVDRVVYLIEKFFGRRPNTRKVGSKKGGVEIRMGCAPAEKPLRALGLIGTRGSGGITRTPCVPECVKKSPTDVIKAFLRGIFEADGHAAKASCAIKFFSKDKSFALDVQLLLLRLGITCRLKETRKTGGLNNQYSYVGYEISLRSSETVAFAKTVGFISERKQARAMAGHVTQGGYMNRRLPIPDTDKIMSIKPVGKQPVYDIQTDDQMFSAGGILVHNCYLEEAFEQAIKGAYYQKEMREMRKEGRICSVPHYRGIAVHTWWDLGMDDAMAIWFVQEVGREIHLIRYEEHSGETMDFYARLLRDIAEEKGYVYGFHIAPHDIEVRELGAGSRWESAARLGIKFVVAPKLDVVDGIDAVRNDMARWWIDQKECEYGIRALDSYQKEWDDRRGTYKKTPVHNWASHAADAVRTGVTGQVSTYRPRAVPVGRTRSFGA